MRTIQRSTIMKEVPISGAIYIGIDNGVSGSIGIIPTIAPASLFPTPIFVEQSYTKTKANISRIDWRKLKAILSGYALSSRIFIERPLVNPGMFKTTMSAMRALESTLIIVEGLGFSLQYVDSKEWQKAMLPRNLKGSAELKKASCDIGKRLFPYLSKEIDKQGDADSLLMAEHFRRICR